MPDIKNKHITTNKIVPRASQSILCVTCYQIRFISMFIILSKTLFSDVKSFKYSSILHFLLYLHSYLLGFHTESFSHKCYFIDLLNSHWHFPVFQFCFEIYSVT